MNKILLSVCILFFAFNLSTAQSQTFGCTDPAAVNFIITATSDDGSCIYNDCDYVSGFNYIGKISSCCYYEYNDTTTWIAANSLCVSNGGSLVSINTVQESDSLNLLLNNNNTGGNQHWINLIDGSSTWENGDPLSFTNYDGSYNPVNGDYMFLQNNGFWDNSPNDGSQSNLGIYPLMEICPTNIIVSGCTDITALNYDLLANTDDGSCVYLFPTISNLIIGSPILCYGGFTDVQVNITQTTPTQSFSCIAGYYIGSYFLSFVSTNVTQANSFSLNLVAGDYCIRLVDSTSYYNGNGGSSSGNSTVGIYDEWCSVVISEPAELVSTTAVVSSNLCTSDCVAAEDLIISGGTGPYSFSFNGGTSIGLPSLNSTYSFTGLCSGSYDIVVADANGCATSPSTTSFNITPIGPIITSGYASFFNSNGYHVSCYGASDGSITAAATGGGGVFTYSIDGINFQSSPVFSALSAGIYTVTYMDLNNCIVTEDLILSEPPSLLGNTSINQDVDCFGSSTGEIMFTIDPTNPGVFPYQYSIDNGLSFQSSNTFSNLIGNVTYTIMIEDNNGCQDNSSIYLSEPADLLASHSVIDVSCNNLSDGIVTINIIGGSPNYILNAFSSSLNLVGSTFVTTSGIPAGSYPFIITDANSCSFNDIVIVSEPALISSIDNINACGSYTWVDGNIYTSNNNTATYIYPAINGCDSIVSLDLNLAPNITNTVVDTSCGEYLFGANIIDTSGTYIEIFTAIGGCDSIVTLLLTIFEDSSVTYITACDSVEWNGIWYYNDTLVTDTGFYTSNAFGGSTVDDSGKEGNIWYFGEFAGLDFNSGTPVALTDGQLNTNEGCASISDVNGDLLFYTDGTTVYNKNHTIMPNGTGLLGNPSSTQSAMIIKKPGTSTIYYIFTVDGMSGAGGGLNYSEVDITLNGGLGDINTNKNILIFPNACEKITAITHQNGTDFWILSRLENSNTYHAYLLTSSGLNMTYVLTNIGPIYNQELGYLKASPNGSKIAAANWFSQSFEIFDFDNNSGLLSNFLTHYVGDAYGLEFSPNSNILYVSEFYTGNILQYNLSAGSNSDITSSEILVGSTYPAPGGAIQLAPDGKIYACQVSTNYLAVINNPDVLGNSCNFNSNAVSLGGRFCSIGLPTFFSSIFNILPSGCDSVATAIIDIKNSSSTYTQVAQCDSFTWALNGQTYYTSEIDTIHSINADSCLHIDSLDLNIYPDINVSAIIIDELCVNYSDGSITLNITGGLGGFTYNWIGPALFSETTKDIFNLSPGSYNLTITDVSSLCTKDTVFVIAAGFDIQLTSSYVDVSCYGFNDGTIDINPINLINPIYNWSDISISLEDRINLSPGFYYLQIDDNNCFVRDTFNIIQPDSLFLTATQTNTTCANNTLGFISVQVSGGIPSYNYYWSNLSNNTSLNDELPPGIYDLGVIDDNGCLLEETFEIFPYEVVVSSIVNHVACYGDSSASIDLTVSGGFQTYSYLWSDNSINEDIYNIPQGNISCTVSDYLGCESIVDFNITQEAEIFSTPVVSGVSCFGGNNGNVVLNITGGVSIYDVDWYNVDENNLSEGNYPYEITDANGCILKDTVYVPQEDSLILEVIVIDLQCSGDPTGKIDVDVTSGGVWPFSYSWSGPNSFNSNQYIINNLYSGLYDLTVTDGNNCSVFYQISVTEPVAVSQDIIFEVSNYSSYGISCKSGSDGWINATPTGGYIPYSFDWTGPNSFSSNNQSITDLSEGLYSVLVINGLGCEEQFVFPMSDPDYAVSGTVSSLYNYNGYDISCYGFNDGGILVEPIGGVSPYTYIFNNVQTLNPLVFQEAGIHLLTLYDNNGCPWEGFIVLNQPDDLIWDINMFPDSCGREVGQIIIDVSGGISPYNYLWSDYQDSEVANQLFEGEYSVEVVDKNGCQIFDTVFVPNLVSPKMDFSIMSDYEKLSNQLENPIIFIDMTELTWQNALYWDWDFGDGTFGTDSISFHSYQEIGEYEVLLKITTDYNCIDTLRKKVVIEEYDLFIPNAFTPQSTDDNINDEFRPYGIGIDDFRMNIYTRWGGLIFTTDDINIGWNGKFKNIGYEVQLGVYVYYIETKDVFGAIHKYEGQVTLIR